MKKNYTDPELNLLPFTVSDIITASPNLDPSYAGGDDDSMLPGVM